MAVVAVDEKHDWIITARYGKGPTASLTSIQSLDTSGQLGAALRAEPACAFLQST